MYLNNYDKGKPYKNQKELLEEYLYLTDCLFDEILEKAAGEDSFDISAELLYDPSLEDTHKQTEDILNWISQRESRSDPATIRSLYISRTLNFNWYEKLLFYFMLLPEVYGNCYKAYEKYLLLRGENQVTVHFYYDLMRYAVPILPDEYLKMYSLKSSFGRYCLESGKESVHFYSECGLKKNILSRICDSQDSLRQEAYFYLEDASPVYGFDRIRSRFSGLIRQEDQISSHINLIGDEQSGRKSLLRLLWKDEKRILVIRFEEMSCLDWTTFIKCCGEIATEIRLEDPCVYVSGSMLDLAGHVEEKKKRYLNTLLRYLPKSQVCFSLSEKEVNELECSFLPFEMGSDDPSVQYQVWEGLLGEYGLKIQERTEYIISKYNLLPGNIRKVVHQLKELSSGEENDLIDIGQLAKAVSLASTIHFDGKAVKLESDFHWEDIELPDLAKQRLKLATKRIRMKYLVDGEKRALHNQTYGRGISILLYGAPGTGKTMCAQVIANELGLDLYRIDLSQLQSKYIGETQKNIGQVFDEAKKGNLILFFDEADSLFGKRTEVTNSNDKHANSEMAYLLQKMEEYPGISILATNLYENFDKAILRRLTYSVKFEIPDEETRRRLWHKILPANAVYEDNLSLDLFVEQFELTGSDIKSILSNAVYLAADEKQIKKNEKIAIGARELVLAIIIEYDKLGNYLDKSLFGEYWFWANDEY